MFSSLNDVGIERAKTYQTARPMLTALKCTGWRTVLPEGVNICVGGGVKMSRSEPSILTDRSKENP